MSATGNHEHGTIPNPGSFQLPSGLRNLFIVFILLGAAAFALGLNKDANRTWASFEMNNFYFMSLAIGGLFIAAVQWVTNAMWSAPIRRISESFTAYLPIALVGIGVLYFGMHHLYMWTNPAHGDPVIIREQPYLNIPFFFARNLVFVLLWMWFAKKLVGNSLAQDGTKDVKLTFSNRAWSPAFLIVFALSYTIMSFDQIMSLDAHWWSTMFGVYTFAGLFYSSLALTCLITLYLQSKQKLNGIVNENHLHDIGKFMFAFTIFWAYIAFAQFMLIWYANMPEETHYYIDRMHGNWMYMSVFLLVGQFVIPFLLLLPRDAKRSVKMLTFVGVWMMIAQWIDVMWMVQPQFLTEGPRFGWIEGGILLGFVGLFALAIFRFLGKHNIVAIGDPRLEEAIFHHHQ